MIYHNTKQGKIVRDYHTIFNSGLKNRVSINHKSYLYSSLQYLLLTYNNIMMLKPQNKYANYSRCVKMHSKHNEQILRLNFRASMNGELLIN